MQKEIIEVRLYVISLPIKSSKLQIITEHLLSAKLYMYINRAVYQISAPES